MLVERNFKPEAIKSYIDDFISRCGYKAISLSNEDYEWVFAYLARLEEFNTDTLHSGHNWELTFSDLSRKDDALTPVVDQQLYRWEAGKKIRAIAEYDRWPNSKDFCVCLTHDIDILHSYPIAYGVRSLQDIRNAPNRLKFFMLGRLFKYSFHRVSGKRNIYSDLGVWLDQEAKHGFRSTLNFMVNNVHKRWDDGFYHLTDRIAFNGKLTPIFQLMREIHQNGWDIGLHGGSATFRDQNLLLAQKNVLEKYLGQPVTSTRQHHLFYDIRSTPYIHIGAGLKTDSTIGSNLNTDFRAGTGLPFFMYDVFADRPTSLLQIPVVIQDVVIARLLDNDEKLMVATITELLERVANVNGCITILWHNHYAVDSIYFKVYKKVLEIAASMNAWGCSMRQLDSWWRSKEFRH